MKKIVSSITMLILTIAIFTNPGFAQTTTVTEYIKNYISR